jgi:hypothetical protein
VDGAVGVADIARPAMLVTQSSKLMIEFVIAWVLLVLSFRMPAKPAVI